MLILIIFVLPAFASPGPFSRLAGDVAFSLLLVAGAAAMAEYRWMRFVVPPMAALALVVRWASVITSSAHLAAWREISSLATLALFAVVVVSRVYRPGPGHTRAHPGFCRRISFARPHLGKRL